MGFKGLSLKIFTIWFLNSRYGEGTLKVICAHNVSFNKENLVYTIKETDFNCTLEEQSL